MLRNVYNLRILKDLNGILKDLNGILKDLNGILKHYNKYFNPDMENYYLKLL